MSVDPDNYVGIPFLMGVRDCLGLTRRYYAEAFGINITDYARPVDWESPVIDLIRACYEREGFEMVTKWREKDLRPGDLLCMSIGEGNANHLAIYLGGGEILHHLAGRRSSREPYRDFWRTLTCYVLRHPDVPDLRPVYPDTTIEELLRARYAR
ncbi:C40 family peptidase [Sphingopyxis indica]|uniref:NlpC/P60 family protein n=1 Tax=Sphingopyxis indica TaxID=436663 RepID=UPI002938CF73|nr:NlpC/P60 family protein [Sphingopyxis indica]WOF44372.1 C40 family peptidase [Sphingopyxis indica]